MIRVHADPERSIRNAVVLNRLLFSSTHTPIFSGRKIWHYMNNSIESFAAFYSRE